MSSPHLDLDSAMLKDKLALYDEKQFMYLARHQTLTLPGRCCERTSPVFTGSVNIGGIIQR